MRLPTPDEMERADRQVAEMRVSIDELISHVEDICGLFMDSLRGWDRLRRDLISLVDDQMKGGRTREQALQATILHGEGTDPETGITRHQSTLGDRLDALSRGGINEQALSGLCVVSIYAHWEDRARPNIARALGITKDDVKSDLFGDLRRMRHALLHSGGRIETGTSFKVLKWFTKNDLVILNTNRFHEVVGLIRNFPDGLETNWHPFPSTMG